ncbi:MAG: AAA family ATPase [Terrimicrobiaceae bacterium]
MTRKLEIVQKKKPTPYGITVQPTEWEGTKAELIADQKVTPEQAEELQWLYNYAVTNAMSQRSVGDLIGMSTSVVSRLFTGEYGAGLTSVCENIKTARLLSEQRAGILDIGFIDTSVWRRIKYGCNMALVEQLPTYAFGDSQCGKTTALEHFAAVEGRGQVRYVRLPACPTVRGMLRKIMESFGPGHRYARGSSDELTSRIVELLKPSHLLVIDELHQFFVSASAETARAGIEKIREIFDRTHCGLVMCGTRVMEERLTAENNAMIYGQFDKRMLFSVMIPSEMSDSDIDAVAAAFGLPPPELPTRKSIEEMIRTRGFGGFIKLLAFSARDAKKKKAKNPDVTFSWSFFAATVKFLKAFSGGEGNI